MRAASDCIVRSMHVHARSMDVDLDPLLSEAVCIVARLLI